MNAFVIPGLKEKRAEIAGKIAAMEAELDGLRRDLRYIDGALHIFGYGDDPDRIKPKRPRVASRLFGRNELQRMLFDLLRGHPDGLTSADMADRVIELKGFDPRDNKLRAAVTHKIGNLLWRLRKRGQVAGEMDGQANVWQLPPRAEAEKPGG